MTPYRKILESKTYFAAIPAKEKREIHQRAKEQPFPLEKKASEIENFS